MLEFEKEKELAEKLYQMLKNEDLSYKEAYGVLVRLRGKLDSKSKLG